MGLSDADILVNLVALNKERAAEEAKLLAMLDEAGDRIMGLLEGRVIQAQEGMTVSTC